MREIRRFAWLGLVLGSVALATSVAVAAGARWHGLLSVSVTVSNGSLPPPSGAPHTTSFSPGYGLSRAQKALNADDIKRLSEPVTNTPCTGGYNVSLKIVELSGPIVKMSAYRCGNRTSGRIGGNVPGFLEAVGISPP